jgi:hypothetical protein
MKYLLSIGLALVSMVAVAGQLSDDTLRQIRFD